MEQQVLLAYQVYQCSNLLLLESMNFTHGVCLSPEGDCADRDVDQEKEFLENRSSSFKGNLYSVRCTAIFYEV